MLQIPRHDHKRVVAKESTTPNKATKPVKAKASLANVSSATIDRDLVFLWKCVKMSTGMKIDWPAVARVAGKSVGTVKKQWSRLNIKLEKSVPAVNTSDSNDADEADHANDEE
ncbi:hypothetical protein N7455_003255 [Penicillium solitum]|uniref:uncharacterized protein n=1 Tax=Penicillium solitum TaxID=60172 RepID=UPI0032C42539|nr:hypothetical protein N7455_003255 [Penicillium solitum]